MGEQVDVVPHGKPSWDEAPSWAGSLAVVDWPCEYRGVWTWFRWAESPPTYPVRFFELRPSAASEVRHG